MLVRYMVESVRRLIRVFILVLAMYLTLPAGASEIIHSITPLATQASLPGAAQHLVVAGKYKSLDCVLQADRFEYWQDDLNGQFLAILPQPVTNPVPARMRITLQKIGPGDKQSTVADATTGQSLTNKFSFLVAMPSLATGKYRATAALVGDDGKVIGSEAECDFDKVDKQGPVVTIPSDGIPIEIEKQEHMADATWPMRAGVPLPINAVKDASQLALFADGKPVPSQIKPIARWCPEGSVQWVHVDFLGAYNAGKPAEYRLKVQKIPPEGGTPNRVTQTDDRIEVDTGAIRFEVNRRKFTGVEKAWFDPSGMGKYDEANPVVSGSVGPYLEDGRMIRFDAANDTNAVVVVEEQGPVRVTIRAEGWYVSADRSVVPLCKFVTRITAFAGQPMLRVSHHTILACDTQKNRFKDIGFHIAATNSETFHLGADGTTKEGPLPASPKTVFLHQDRYDHFRLVGLGTNTVDGAKSDGWFSIGSTNSAQPSLTVVLRDIWQKFPKEVEMGRDGLTLHFWPRHGHRAFTLEDELDIKNIYKFWCFHQGAMLDLYLPTDYFEALAGPYQSGTTECRPEFALNGNGEGLAIGNEFQLLFTAGERTKKVPKLAQLFQRDPAARASSDWNAATGALGKMDAADRRNFPALEEAIEKGWLSWTRNVDRGNAYGMWIWPNTHTYWNVEGNDADLHRVWNNSHYHQVGQTWLMYYRSGSPDLLRWARTSTDHWMNIGTINHATFNERDRPVFNQHWPGAMYHCKALTPWGARERGMSRRDTDAGLWGHWIDPDAFLWDWYLNGNPRAKDVYDLWAGTISKYADILTPIKGSRREINTSLAYALTYYQATWDAGILPHIRGMGLDLRTSAPLDKQAPGPIWHPLWMNRYYEQMRDPDYVPLILESARRVYFHDTWTTGLGALAHELSGDRSYLTQHFEPLTDFPKQPFRATGDPYDWYGVGPGPLGDCWGAFFCWGNFLQALRKANITDLTPQRSSRFACLVGGSRAGGPPSLAVVAFEPKDRPFKLSFQIKSLGGGPLVEQYVAFLSPSGKELVNLTSPKERTATWTETRDIPPDGESGLYQFRLTTSEARMFAPVTDLPTEAMMIKKDALLNTVGLVGYLHPTDESQPVQLTIASGGQTSHRYACNVTITDAAGKEVAKASLFKPRNTPAVTLTLDPRQHKLPWKLDVYGPATIRWNGASENLMFSASEEALRTILSVMKKLP